MNNFLGKCNLPKLKPGEIEKEKQIGIFSWKDQRDDKERDSCTEKFYPNWRTDNFNIMETIAERKKKRKGKKKPSDLFLQQICEYQYD